MFAYEQFWKDLSTFSQAWDKVLLPSSFSTNPGSSHRVIEQVKSPKFKKLSNFFFSIQQIPKESRFLQPSPIMMLKAVKNSIEIQGMRRAHVRDGTAMCEFMAYFEDKVIFCYYFLIYFANHVLHFRCLRVRSGLNSRWRIPWTVSGTTSSSAKAPVSKQSLVSEQTGPSHTTGPGKTHLSLWAKMPLWSSTQEGNISVLDFFTFSENFCYKKFLLQTAQQTYQEHSILALRHPSRKKPTQEYWLDC